MVNIFSVVFILSAFSLIVCFFLTRKLETAFSPYLKLTQISLFMMVLCHLVIINSQNLYHIKLAYTVFYILMNVMLFLLFEFCRKYTRYRVKLPWFTKVLYLFLLTDLISLIVNFTYNHQYILRPFYYMMGNERFVIFKTKMYFMHYLHLALTYLLLILILTVLVIRLYRTPKLYRTAFIHLSVSISFIIIGDAVWMYSKFPIDFSIVFYTITVILISLYSGSITPRQILYRQLEAVVSNMNDAVRFFDIYGECIYTNKAMNKLIEKYTALGLNPLGPFKSLESGDYFRKLKNLPDREFDEDVCNNNRIYNFHVSTHCLRDEENNFLGAFFIVHDKTKEVEKVNNDLYLAYHDSLTKILNKEGFFESVRTVITNEPDEEYYMVCSDVDNFKLINDNFGHEAGDEFLIRIAEVLTKLAKPNEVYCRLAGDRFALFMKKSDFDKDIFISNSKQVAYLKQDIRFPVTFHFGVYEIEDISMPIASMIDRAYIAIGKIKGNLQEPFAFYNDSMRNNILREQQIIGEFPLSLATDQFKMYLQPQVSTENVVKGAEALVRWEHQKEGILSPHEFIPIFEQNGLITKLDLYIWDLAAQKLKDWKKRGLNDYYISVNISPKDFLYADLYKIFTGLVERYEIDPKNLKLEITESSLMSNFDLQLKLINNLREYGFQIEMDDFGSGYSSLNLLKDIPFDVLKIDMGFLSETKNTGRSISILRSIINLSKGLNMPVITEGVETKEQVEFLREMGTDYYQGFYFDRPMKIEDFEKKYIK